ncbi:MAG: aldo/keto reductase [Chloroflexota bacterium]|nr:aldo/keto reductase [Chloroflexota bacterium]
MQRRRLGRTDLDVSEIGLGALEIGRDWGIRDADFGRPPEHDAIALIHAALDLGINFIDTAPAYQLSEERIGKALQGHRQEVYLATKVGEHYDNERGFWYDYGEAAVRASVEQSLRRLRTDMVDILQIHSASADLIQQGETYEALKRLQDAGHVRFLGMSGDLEAARAAIEHGGFDTVQIVYNIFNQDAATSLLPLARSRDIGVVVMAPLGHGALTSKHEHLDPEQPEYRLVKQADFLVRPEQTLAQAALRFVLQQDAVSTIIAGTRKPANLRLNVEAAAGSLTPEELDRLHQLDA